MSAQNDGHHNNDEVSIVLQHFQPKPEYLLIQKVAKKKIIGSFTSVIYKNDNTLKLVYLYQDGIITLDIRISTVQPYALSYINNEIQRDKERSLVDSLCSKISAESRNAGSSLFSVVSRLLLSLNKLDLPVGEEVQCAALQSHVSRLASNRRLSWDLPLVLMRCAATSRKSSKLCIPLPADFSHEPGAIVKIRDNLISPSHQADRREQSMLAFLASRHWTEVAKLSTKAVLTEANRKNIKVTIDLTNVSDATPRFSKLVKERGSITAFHGTTVDRVWSILNFGLLSHTSLQENGAMMGEGVYLTTSYDVAYFFATKDTKRLARQVWWQPSFWNVIGMVAPVDELENWIVTCYAVVESTIILPPRQQGNKVEEGNCTRRAGKYYVVPNPQDMRINKVHLTVELSKRQRLPFLFLTLCLVLALGLVRYFWF
jgi:hypothetical protein